MLPNPSGGLSFAVTLPNEQATRRLAIDLATILEAGDLITLSGDLGAGKTAFARALIRAVAGDDTIEVPSPSFTLMQVYELPRFPIVHADLFRLSGSAELAELGFEDLPENAVTLLEWPDRAASYLPTDRIDLSLKLAPHLGEDVRNARITAHGALSVRVERMITLHQFLAESGFGEADRLRMQGDASTRLYERLRLPDRKAIFMNSPRRPDGPPVRDGKPYSAIAHLAEDVTPFVAIANGLRARGFSAPDIFNADLEKGLVVLEDLGDQPVVADEPPAPIEDRYACAIDVLAELHRQELPDVLPVAPGIEYRIPRYDLDAFLIEAELLLEWYLPRLGVAVTMPMQESFRNRWRLALQPAIETPPTWVLRDFHSPNLLWLPDREDIARIGILDFQDALIGPAAYDVASLLQDARVDVPEADGDHLARPLCPRARGLQSRIQDRRFRAALRHHGGPARHQDPRDLRAARPARRQAAIFTSHAADMELPAARARPSRPCAAQGLVQSPRPQTDIALDPAMTDSRHPASPRRAMVLAAGLGTRMRAFNGGALPKPLVKVGGKALIDHVLDRLAAADVAEAVVNVHHLADTLETHLAARQRPAIVISDERAQLLNTGGGIANALPLLGEAPFYLINSDTIWIDSVKPNLVAPGRGIPRRGHGRAAAAGADRDQHRLWRTRRFRDDAGRPPDPARRTRGGAVRLCRGRDPVAAIVCRRAARAVLAHHPVRPGYRGRAALRVAARRRLDACRHARGGRRRRGSDPGKRGVGPDGRRAAAAQHQIFSANSARDPAQTPVATFRDDARGIT